MAISDEDKKELAGLMQEVLQRDFEQRRGRRLESDQKREAEKVTALYLVTFAGHQIALPGERGRAILSNCIYAKVKVNPENPAIFGGQSMEAIADGDGRKFKEPRNLILTGSQVCSMVEVPESYLVDTL